MELSVENVLREGRELRRKARSTQLFAPKLSGRSDPQMRPGLGARTPYNPPGRRSPVPRHGSGDDAESIEEIQRKGRKIREMLRNQPIAQPSASPPSSATNQLRTATPIKGRPTNQSPAATPVKARPNAQPHMTTPLRGSPTPSICLRTPGGPFDVDKRSNQNSSRSSQASTATPQMSDRSLRTPAPSPQSSARSFRHSPQSSARSLRQSVAGSPPLSVRPPKAPAQSPKLQPAPSSVLFLPERMAEAARRGDAEETQQCIAELPEGAPVCVKDIHGWTPLHYAASGGHAGVCQLLLEARGDANAELPDFSTPIMLAVEEGDMCVAKLLLQNGARTRSKDEAGFTVMDRCAPWALTEFTSCVQQYM